MNPESARALLAYVLALESVSELAGLASTAGPGTAPPMIDRAQQAIRRQLLERIGVTFDQYDGFTVAQTTADVDAILRPMLSVEVELL